MEMCTFAHTDREVIQVALHCVTAVYSLVRVSMLTSLRCRWCILHICLSEQQSRFIPQMKSKWWTYSIYSWMTGDICEAPLEVVMWKLCTSFLADFLFLFLFFKIPFKSEDTDDLSNWCDPGMLDLGDKWPPQGYQRWIVGYDINSNWFNVKC